MRGSVANGIEMTRLETTILVTHTYCCSVCAVNSAVNMHSHTHHTYTQSKVTAACNEKTMWLEHHQGAPLSDIQDELTDFEERLKPYLAKLEAAQ